MKKIACILLLSLLLQLCACKSEPVETQPTQTTPVLAAPVAAVDLMSHVTAKTVSGTQPDALFSANAANLALCLLQGAYQEGETCVISPYSILTALAMSANGADGLTLAQMQDVLGLSVQELNEYLKAAAQNAGEELSSANSLWMHRDITVSEPFLQTVADYYVADAYSVPFDDVTLTEINAWISEKTKGRIENALEDMHPNAVLYLINALSFDAEWQRVYNTNNLVDGVFHGAKGDEEAVMMCSEESLYLQDGEAGGFLKPYAGGQYSYVALLPNEGVDVGEYLLSLDAEGLLDMVRNPESATVIAKMPKHCVRTKLELQEILSSMGMEDAFTDRADFSQMTDTEIKISRILHQTYLNVDELGTQAGAVTIEEFVAKGVLLEPKTVTLDRPYVMGIYDHVNECFLFLGVIESLS